MYETGASPDLRSPASSDKHIPTGSEVVITFGRNVGDEPMHDVDWQIFQDMVTSAVNDLLSPVEVFPFRATGEWRGITEDSICLVVITGYPCGIREWEERLATLARIFNQDAIAYTYGPNTLVSGVQEVAA